MDEDKKVVTEKNPKPEERPQQEPKKEINPIFYPSLWGDYYWD